MGLFSRNFDKPGPGVEKDTPRKTGIPRFFELLLRDFFDYIKMSVLFSISVLPSAAAFVFGTLPYIVPFITGTDPQEYGGTGLFIVPLVLSVILAYPVGGAVTACFFNITRFMRDDASYLWYDFKRKFKENHRQAALPGIFCTVFVYMQLLLWIQVYFSAVEGVFDGGLMWVVLTLLSIVLFGMITPYLFMHLAYIDMKTSQILKNSLLMTIAFLPRSFMGAFCGGIMWIVIALFMPNSLIIAPLIFLILVSLSMLLTLSWVWPPFEKNFDIEEELRKKREQRELEQQNESLPPEDIDNI